MCIYKALLKHKHSKFSLEILEYCPKEKLLEREQYFIDLFLPKYNLLKEAGSPLGRVTTEETKAKLSAAALGRKHTEETKAKLSAQNIATAIGVEVMDLDTGISTVYDSIGKAAKVLNCRKSTIQTKIKFPSSNPYII